jgi:4-amino-4-deoxy-L-arabinose transferase-like glycosyltransferase
VNTANRLLDWADRYERDLVLVLVALAVALRVALVAEAPAFGYVWDFYHEGVAVLAREGRLPVAADCWQCYHPPLFYLAGWPFFAAGEWLRPGDAMFALRLLGGVSLASVAVIGWAGYRLLVLLGHRGASLVAGLALLLASPILFISSYGAEADIVLTAILSVFAVALVRAEARDDGMAWRDVIGLGVLAGLAAATKYSGLIALATAGLVTAIALIRARGASRRTVAIRGLVIAVLAAAIGASSYVDNWRTYGTPMHANGSAAEGLSLASPFSNQGGYEFTSFRWAELRALFGPRPAPGDLTDFPVYKSVPTALHAQAWSDMSFFSVPSRHGAPGDPYPRRRVPVDLTMTVIGLGFVPEALAALGVLVTWRRRTSQALAAFSLVTIAAYVAWFLPQTSWALKTKYILCLLPPGVAFALAGQAWLWRQMPLAGAVTGVLWAALVVTAFAYQYVFAAGSL